MGSHSYKAARALMSPIMKFVGRVEVIGSENIPATGGVIICANHVSFIDPPTLGWACPRQLRFMGKAELFDKPIVGEIARSLDAFPIHRGTADRAALQTAIDSLNAGFALAMFPEGTCSVDGNLLEPHPGVGMIALRSKAVIIPCALVGTEKLMPLGHRHLSFSRVKVIFGKPVEYADLQQQVGKAAIHEISRRIMSAIGELLKIHRDLVKGS